MKQETIAIIPGAFRPPTEAHYNLIKYYFHKVDKVIVLVSNPKQGSKSARTINEKEISAINAVKLLKFYTNNLITVEVRVSDHPSPVKATYDLIEEMKDCHVVVGSSFKDGDDKRWSSIEKYMKKKNPSVQIEIDTSHVFHVEQGIVMSASQLRDVLEKQEHDKLNNFIPGHVDKEKAKKLLLEMV